MKRKAEIEAALERSLRARVKVPPVDVKFDAEVWARIEAAARPATSVVPASSAGAKAGRWLDIINIAGLASAAIVVAFFGVRMLSGMDIAISLPEFSKAVGEGFVTEMSLGFAGAAILFGFWNTPWGRRLRDELG